MACTIVCATVLVLEPMVQPSNAVGNSDLFKSPKSPGPPEADEHTSEHSEHRGVPMHARQSCQSIATAGPVDWNLKTLLLSWRTVHIVSLTWPQATITNSNHKNRHDRISARRLCQQEDIHDTVSSLT